ncbi:MAG: hypothetical protein H2065_02170 [Candidatus Poseidoniales archaeon]|nr:hypothetical protein [Candidatus Poseidoniales archaeon]
MENDFEVALLLWAPLGFVFLSLGLQFRKDSSSQKFGKVLGAIGFVLFGASFLTVPSSPSAASSSLLVNILPSLGLMVIGLYIALFAGEIPVKRFPSRLRPMGLLMFVTGFALFEAMHWTNHALLPSTMWEGESNRFWMIFRPTFLLAMSSFLLASGYLVNLIGQRISQTSKILYLTGSVSLVLLILSVMFDGSSTTSDEFHNSVLLAASDILGFLSGVGLTIIVFGLTIWQYERKRPGLHRLPPPDQEQLNTAAEIVRNNIGGGEDE